jgi:voltage-gated potassium channel
MNSTAARAGRPSVIAGITAALRVIVVAAAEVTAFYLLPLNANRRMSGGFLAVVGVSLLVVVLGLQVWAITRSPLPEVRAVEALAGFITLLLVGFAFGYYMLSSAATSNFTQTLTRTDALYFTTTVFSTVGFGDIAPVSETARVLVTSQMVLDLVVLGAGLKIVGGAVKLGRERRDRQGPTGNGPTEQPAGLTELQGGETRS